MKFPSVPPYNSRRSSVMAENMVATSHPLAAQAGLSMLAKGGNAVDAALASAMALTVVEPTGNGLGSDGFAILWDGKELHGMNASGRSPAGWTPERFKDGIPERGWDSVSVPGAVGGWVALSEKFGRLPFADLAEPAIRYAEEGFPVSPVIATLWGNGAALLHDQPGFADHFMPNGRAPVAGERFVAKDTARSLRLIAETKGEAFYRGELAEKIVADATKHGGAMTLDDLAAEKPDWCGTITPIRDLSPEDPKALHLMWEAMKLAFRDVDAYVADGPAMTEITSADLLDDGYLAERAKLIDPTRAQDFGSGAPKRGGTVYLCAADKDGMMVSYIQSNYAGFGSGVVVPGTGIHLQNRGCGFTLEDGHPNQVAPRKRPFHTIIPGFLTAKGQPRMAFGVMGGPMQAQGHLQMLLRTQIWGQDVQTAADAPRWRVTNGLGVACETAMPSKALQSLVDLGHHVSLESPDSAFGFGGAQLIHRLEDGGYAGGSDPRKDGCAVGF